MEIFSALLVLLLAIAIELAAAFAFRDVARMKGHDESRYFWWCFLFPPVGYLLVISLPDRRPAAVPAQAAPAATSRPALYRDPDTVPSGSPSHPVARSTQKGVHSWRCSGCGQMISARPCPHCGQE